MTEANSINAATAGLVGNTGTGFTGTAVTEHYVLVGGSTSSTITNVSPSTSGFVLTSNGASADPSFQAASGGGAFTVVAIQAFTASGTYTPTAGMKYCIIELVGSGGGGGGVSLTVGSQVSAGGGGGAGGYARKVVSAATIGSSQTVTIGAAGTAGTAGGGTGGNGNTTSVGAIVSATGGTGGGGGGTPNFNIVTAGGAGGAGSSGDLNLTGGTGGTGIGIMPSSSGIILGGQGGNSYFGQGGIQTNMVPPTQVAGVPGYGYGAGGSGGASLSGNTAAGGAGVAGYVLITEFI